MLCLIFHCFVNFSVPQGGGNVELVPGGREIDVTPQNVYDYIRRYAEYRMLRSQEKALEVSIFSFPFCVCVIIVF